MTLSKYKINDIWRSGYCQKTVEHAKNTAPGPAGSYERVAYLSEHAPGCLDCRCADILKQIESEAAAAMGAGFHELFRHGGDVADFPAFRPLFEKIFRQHCESGSIKDGPVDVGTYMRWLYKISQRGPYPEHTKKKKGRRW